MKHLIVSALATLVLADGAPPAQARPRGPAEAAGGRGLQLRHRADELGGLIARGVADGSLDGGEGERAILALASVRRLEDTLLSRGHGFLAPSDRLQVSKRLDALESGLHWRPPNSPAFDLFGTGADAVEQEPPQDLPRAGAGWRDPGALLGLLVLLAAAFGLPRLRGWRPAKRTPLVGREKAQEDDLAAPHLEDLLPHAHSRSPGLDAMRAAAILIVMGFHWIANFLSWFGVPVPPNLAFAGTLGVEVFFALSGFLIGQILITQAGADPSLKNFGVFLVRRWLRTLPLYFVVIALLLVLIPPPGPPALFAIKFGTFSQNLLGPMPPGGWFAVSWSLTIEEWFYIFFGCATFLSFRLIRAPWAIWPPVLCFLIVPMGLRIVAPAKPEVWLLLDQIAYGVGMAQLFRGGRWPFRHPAISAAAGLCLIAVGSLASTWLPPRVYVAVIWNITILGCALLLPAAVWLRKIPGLGHRLIGAVSAQSYCLYLIHLPVLELARQAWANHLAPAWVCIAAAVVSPFLLSYLSFRFFESPILRLRPRQTVSASPDWRPAA